MDSQGDLFPFASPETVLAHCRRLQGTLLGVAPEMSKLDCTEMLFELALAQTKLDKIVARIRQTPEFVTREELPPAATLVLLAGGAAPRTWRPRNGRKRSTPSFSPR